MKIWIDISIEADVDEQELETLTDDMQSFLDEFAEDDQVQRCSLRVRVEGQEPLCIESKVAF